MSSWIYGVQNVGQKVPPPPQPNSRPTYLWWLSSLLPDETLQVTDRIQGDRRTEMICLLFWVKLIENYPVVGAEFVQRYVLMRRIR